MDPRSVRAPLSPLADNHRVDNTLKLPLALFVTAVVLFPAPGVALLLMDGHWGSAFLVMVGMAYAIGLGRVLLWRRLGRPAVPARQGQSRDTTHHPS